VLHLVYEFAPANNRFEYARGARPTHKVQCTLFASQAKRSAFKEKL